MTRHEINQRLRDGKLSPERAGQYLSALDLCATCTDRQVAAFTGLTPRQVERLRECNGITKHRTWTPPKVRLAWTNRRRGYTWREIAAQFGCTERAVKNAALRLQHLAA